MFLYNWINIKFFKCMIVRILKRMPTIIGTSDFHIQFIIKQFPRVKKKVSSHLPKQLKTSRRWYRYPYLTSHRGYRLRRTGYADTTHIHLSHWDSDVEISSSGGDAKKKVDERLAVSSSRFSLSHRYRIY